MSRWLRINEDCIDNPKILKLPEALRWQWVALLCVASKNGGVLPPIDDVSLCLRVPEAKAAEFITRLVQAKLIDRVGEHFEPHNWSKRQYKSDVTDPTAPQRMKRYRDRKRNESNGGDRNERNEPVTVIRPEAETEADTEQSRADASAPVDEGLKKKVVALQFGIGALFTSRQQPIPNLDRCLLWLTQGYAPGTVLGAIEAVLKRGKSISTLDYFDGAIRDRHAADMPVAALVDTMADWYVIIEGTTEEVCWQQYSRETTGRPMFICDQIHNGNTVRGAKKPTLFPPGFNDFGERISPAENEENAA